MNVSSAVRKIKEMTGWDVTPQEITNLFYYRKLDDSVAPVVDGRRDIPEIYLREIIKVLFEIRQKRGNRNK